VGSGKGCCTGFFTTETGFVGRDRADLLLLFDALGGSGALRLHPRRVGIPHVGIALNWFKKKLRKRGSRGCSPWVASPSGGERGSLSKLP